jgi:hypothetical protein
MQKRVYIVLFLVGLAIAVSSAYLQSSPGYMDAYYYFYGGSRLAEGYGLTENFLWNYLDDPAGLPHAAFSYWMPFTSFWAAAGIRLFAGLLGSFRAAQVGFILIAACISPLTASLAWELTNERGSAWFSGLLAAFMGYYQPFVVAIDAFGIYMLLGGVFFLVVSKGGRYRYVILGLIAGLMHLTRADGILWLGMAGLAALIDILREERAKLFHTIFSKTFVIRGLVIVGGYLLVLSPWFVRNIVEFGTLLSPGGGKTIWVLSYDELYSYPADILTFSRWWEAGLSEIFSIRFEVLYLNLQSTLASLGMIFPAVFAAFGFFRCRRKVVVQLGGIYWLLLVFVMTVVFPFAGFRGGFFHSGAALMPLIWVMVPVGVDAVTEWSVKTLKWETRKIKPFFIGMLFVYVILFSLAISYTNIIGTDPDTAPGWDQHIRTYAAVEEAIQDLTTNSEEIIITATPPAYTSITGRPSIAIPDGGIEPLLAVIERYDAKYVLLETNHPAALEELFEQPRNVGELKYFDTIEGVHLFGRVSDE